MKFEELPDVARVAAIEVYKMIAIRELVLVDNECKEQQTARLENLAESLVKGFSKLYDSACEYGIASSSHCESIRMSKPERMVHELAKEEGITFDQAIKLVADMIIIRRANLPKDGQVPVVCNGQLD
ncbi:hypothetical protein [Xenorhabdus hominickii]|uniref:Transcriptional regulator n=1 Tax=Xenorhabdus hominickii TaxID=351679 RepID=A0A2G0Q2I5_XENHO|nr:hypothetical protein [Xenorhabdus hominickii]AOM39674.1 hypothetical protein A9255_03160 [Xenorhabdus hominickii]PHM53433.1 transcriptional regulator [Xenorhabdus hominickii]